MDHAIEEMETLRSANEQKIFEIQRINGQLNKALEVIDTILFISLYYYSVFIQTVKQTVDMKEKLEADLYRKVNKPMMCIHNNKIQHSYKQKNYKLTILVL